MNNQGHALGVPRCHTKISVLLRANLTGTVNVNRYRSGTERVKECERNGYRTDTATGKTDFFSYVLGPQDFMINKSQCR